MDVVGPKKKRVQASDQERERKGLSSSLCKETLFFLASEVEGNAGEVKMGKTRK